MSAQNDLLSLGGRVAVVTGAARGMGAVYAQRLLDAGASVVAADRDWSSGDEAPTSRTETLRLRTVDLSVASEVDDLIRVAVADFGRLDILINNAAIIRDYDVLAMTNEEWNEVIDVDLTAAFRVAQAAAREMKAAGGAILNMSSVAGLKARPNRTAYCVAKAGVAHMTRCLAYDLGRYDIRVNALAPGFVETRMLEPVMADPDARAGALAQIPLGRFALPDDVVNVGLFLVSDAARYVTGQVLPVDGGVSAN